MSRAGFREGREEGVRVSVFHVIIFFSTAKLSFHFSYPYKTPHKFAHQGTSLVRPTCNKYIVYLEGSRGLGSTTQTFLLRVSFVFVVCVVPIYLYLGYVLFAQLTTVRLLLSARHWAGFRGVNREQNGPGPCPRGAHGHDLAITSMPN